MKRLILAAALMLAAGAAMAEDEAVLGRGKDLFACWIAQPNGTVMVLFEDGRFAELPISEFQKDEGI